jgi:hypothetical protein
LAIGAAVALANPSIAQNWTFGGYLCKQQCDLHAAGYEWAKARGIEDKRLCVYGISRSFGEGCMAYIQNPDRDTEEDDQGNPVGVLVAPPG